MAHPEISLAKLNKFELIIIALDYQEKQERTLEKGTNRAAQAYSKLEPDLIIARSVNGSVKNQVTVLEHKCCSNPQYCKRAMLKISGIPNILQDICLETKMVHVLAKMTPLLTQLMLKSVTGVIPETVPKKYH